MSERNDSQSSRQKDPPMYPRNHWYVAAWSRELVQDKVFARRIFDQELVLYRRRSGEPVVQSGLCPHRRMPLALGTLFGEELECRYHGITFDADGRCVRIPTQDTIPPTCRLDTYPAVERGPWIWVWPGDPAQADPALIPDTRSLGLGHPQWRAMDNGTYLIEARQQLYVDNLMDLSHVYALHFPPGLSRNLQLPRIQYEERGERKVVTTATLLPADEFTRLLFPQAGPAVFSVFDAEYIAPGLINAVIAVHQPNPAMDGPGAALGTLVFPHALTPKSATATHLFMAEARNFRIDDADLDAPMRESNLRILTEDKAALEAIEAHLGSELRYRMSVAADSGALRVRRHIDALIAAEQAGARPSNPDTSHTGA
ncbi:MAG: Rieske 2Fe-2S domain-containing protein [Sinimarinibacterium flocculans]|uniref:Rieske 2Fe-2S domain-containing protein n=1 Tax=Sinimarinibacterium flocculans TaxID=985250 RepID=UPI003C6A5AE9